MLLADSVVQSANDSLVVKVAFTGDIMGHDPIIQSAFDKVSKNYDYTPIFRHVAPYFRTCNLVIGNLELTLGGAPYSGYPQFSSPDQLAFDLHRSGYNLLLTANNHAYDRGKKGMERTLSVLDSIGMMHTGTFRDTAERERLYPFLWQHQHFRLAILNYTYDTNGIRVHPPNVVNLIDTAQIRIDLAKARHLQADFILVIFHWGNQYEQYENKEQRSLAQFCINLGADAILGAHPHVVQPFDYLTPQSDTLKKVPVFFSVGNFISNQRTLYRDSGIIAELTLVKKGNRTHIQQVGYHLTWVHKQQPPKIGYTIIPIRKGEAGMSALGLTRADWMQMMLNASHIRKQLHNVSELPWDF